MRVLLDHSAPAPLCRHLPDGELLTAAETAGFDVLVTSDKNMRYQQNLTGRKIAVSFLAGDSGPLCARMCGLFSKP